MIFYVKIVRIEPVLSMNRIYSFKDCAKSRNLKQRMRRKYYGKAILLHEFM